MRGGAGVNLVQVFGNIKDIQKRFKTRELEKKELEVRNSLCSVGVAAWSGVILYPTSVPKI